MPPDRMGLSETDPHFETLFEHAPFSIQVLSCDGRTRRVNKAREAMWQVSDSDGVKAYVLNEYNILNDPQLAAKGVTDTLRRAFAGESVTLPTVFYDPSEAGRPGRARWIEGYAHPVKDSSGQVRDVILIHRDISDQVHSDHALQLSELRLKQLANTIPQLAWMAEPDGSIHWYNERWYEYTGTTLDDMRGWGWQSVHHPEALPQVMALWTRSLTRGEPFEMSFPLRDRHGEFRTFLTLVAPLKDANGRVVQWFGTNTDVSLLERAEQKLRRTEERLRLAVRTGNIGIWEWEIEQDRVTWSDEIYALHGMPLGTFGGRVEDFSALVHPDGRLRWLSTWAQVHGSERRGGHRMVSATISVDDYKRAEAQLRDADRRKDEFLAMLAHELRNPLAPISTAAYLLKTKMRDETTVRVASEIITRQVKHVTELVDDLLDVSRVTRGLIQLERSVLDVKSVIANAVEQARPEIEARGHVFKSRLGADSAHVLGDNTRLIQVVVNLLNNAAKYTANGGEIELALDVKGDNVCIRVTDNGAGIDAEFLPSVFELFTQGPRAPSRSEGGLGIGLALVNSIVKMHSGSVTATSDGLGKGSTFTIALPRLHDKAHGDAPIADQPAHRASEPLDIVVVDDNEDAAHSLKMWLESEGHRVVVKHNANSTLDGLQEIDPRVFILDIGLPDLDGYELARRLKKRFPKAMFIALSGYGQTQDRVQSDAAGFRHHFLKPVDTRLLTDAMQGVR